MEYERLGDTAGLSSREIYTFINDVDGRDVWHWHHSLSGVLGNDRGLQETDRDRNTKVEICMLSEIIFKIMLYQILIELYNFIRHSYCLLG